MNSSSGPPRLMTLEGTDVIYGPLVAERPPWRCLWGHSLFGELMKTYEDHVVDLGWRR